MPTPEHAAVARGLVPRQDGSSSRKDDALGRRGVEIAQMGQSGTYSHTVTTADIATFTAVSGDDNALHVEPAFAAQTRFGAPIAHGALLIGYMSAAFTAYYRRWLEGKFDQIAISYGYDRIRFIRPAYAGDTLVVEHRIAEVDPAEDKAFADVTCTNQRGEVVAAARHIVKFL